ncbi:putative membrane protein [Escovopsis weberi]|uniref:Putative membrane protein n=1 Tax=Escovopsis weberi TaxID=150374 RepID=A0A0M8MZI2_ESCWE|nr:putative membrane protein [Escovopsis weberi]
MSSLVTRLVAGPARWLYHEFGIASVHQTGPDGWLILLARACRMFSFGAISLIMALFLSSLRFSDLQIGAFMTLTLVGDVVLSLLLAAVADGIGRRRIFLVGGLLMAASGLVFTLSENYWVLLGAAVGGVMSATGGDFGPFRSIEESTLAHLTTPATRADVLSWYVTTSTLGSAAGMEVSGRIVDFLKAHQGRDTKRAYHLMFWAYVAMGVLSMVLSFLMSRKCEINTARGKDDAASSSSSSPSSSSSTTADEDTRPLLGEDTAGSSDSSSSDSISSSSSSSNAIVDNNSRQGEASSPWWRKVLGSRGISQISPESRPVIIKLWILLTIDSLADGMVTDALTNLYLTRKFGLSESYLGDIMASSYLLMALSTVFAGPLARRLGLVNTMVFTHLPSSAAVLLLPLPQGIALSIVLLLIDKGLNSMDQGPRAALIAAIVRPEERTVVMGITTTLRTLASTVGPSLTGYLAGTDSFWIAYVIAGLLRIGYDLGLFWIFVGIKLHAHEESQEDKAEE